MVFFPSFLGHSDRIEWIKTYLYATFLGLLELFTFDVLHLDFLISMFNTLLVNTDKMDVKSLKYQRT